MQYEFKRALRIEKKTFGKGVREVSKEIEAHPHFAQYVEAGLIGEPPVTKVKNGDSFQERNRKLAEKLKAQVTPPVREQKPVEPPAAPPVDPDEPSKGDEPLTPPSDPPAETELTPAQKASATRKANAEAKKAEEK